MMENEKKRGFWNILRPSASVATSTPLSIRSAGLCCAVGYNLDAASCAMRANMDHFQQSEFSTPERDKVIVARLDDDDLWGQGRLAKWIALAVADCMSSIGEFDASTIPLIWLAPEAERNGADGDWYAAVFTAAVQQLNLDFHPRSGIMPLGRAGLANALRQAEELLDADDCDYVLVVGADTYLNAPSINAYLAAERLQIPGNSDGFIPGEAASAILLQKIVGKAKPGQQIPATLVHISGFGISEEPGRPDGSVPSKARGLTQAIRAALESSQLSYDALDFRVSDQNGEAFFSREAANAFTRVTPLGGKKLPLITIADCLGEVGAAAGPAMLAYLTKLMPHHASPGSCGLLHLANDDGLRSAIVLQYHNV